MRYLPDTQILLWFLAEPHRLDPNIIADLVQSTSPPQFSAISIWEIAIKQSLGRSDFTANAQAVHTQLLLSGWQEISFTGLHAARVATLAEIHKDPFDRALLAQAMVESCVLLTADATLALYPGPIRHI